jgi:hypothetical protein
MAWTYADILKARYTDIESEQVDINASIERARVYEDAEGLASALERHDANQGRLRSLNEAVSLMQRQQQPQAAGFGDDVPERHRELAQQYGLSPQQIGVATQDPNISDEVKVKRYCENVNELARMRASGQYRDDQGTTVKRWCQPTDQRSPKKFT